MTTATPTLTSWLLECIAADEAAARAATEGGWVARTGASRMASLAVGEDVWIGDVDYDPDAAHIARHDPAHVLAVCAAHRSIVEAHPHRDCSEYERTWGSHTLGCATCHEFDGIVTASGYCPTLRALATAYADRPGWQEAWR